MALYFSRGALQAMYGNDASNAVKREGHYVGAGKKPTSGLTNPDKGRSTCSTVFGMYKK